METFIINATFFLMETATFRALFFSEDGHNQSCFLLVGDGHYQSHSATFFEWMVCLLLELRF
jgi:hypothetical protein